MSTHIVRFLSGLTLSFLFLAGCGAGKSKETEEKPAPPKLPRPTAPASSAPKKSSIGSGKLSVTPPSADGQGFPSEMQTSDVDGDGDSDPVEVLYDESREILYYAGEMQLPCGDDAGDKDDFSDGPTSGTGTANYLVAVYLEGNSEGKPAGSGYYLISAAAGQCGQTTSEILGCELDANGNESNCGACEFDPTGAKEPVCK